MLYIFQIFTGKSRNGLNSAVTQVQKYYVIPAYVKIATWQCMNVRTTV
jgi:hypothetical protein